MSETELGGQETPEDDTVGPPASAEDSDEALGGQDDDTFTREYVEGLRAENARYRVKAQRVDELEHQLHRALVQQTALLADPADLEFNPEHLQSPEALTAAITALLEAKPHLRQRAAPQGDVGQGRRGPAEGVSLLGLLRSP